MPSPFVRRLENFEALSAGEKQAILEVSENVRTLGPRNLIIQEGDKPHNASLVLDGIACRYKLLADGGRQITAFLIPGDLCDGHMFVLDEMDHSIGTISACTIADIDPQTLAAITQKYPRIARALWWTSLSEKAVLREWLTNVGRQPADKRTARLLCELFMRLQAVGKAKGNSFEVPLSQIDLADATALSTVHINRVLRKFRERRLVAVERRSITIRNVEALMSFAEFYSNYLHLKHRGRRSFS
jgi:CRP-like cAMP-binding protein